MIPTERVESLMYVPPPTRSPSPLGVKTFINVFEELSGANTDNVFHVEYFVLSTRYKSYKNGFGLPIVLVYNESVSLN